MGKNKGEDVSVTMNLAKNFEFVKYAEVTSELLDDPTAFVDKRSYMLSSECNFSSMDWYLNYLSTTDYFARKNPSAYPTYLCQLGYIPVVYLPTCVPPQLGVRLMLILDNNKIPYVKMRGTTFVRRYFDNDVTDAWVHKFDAAKVLSCKPEDVRSIAFVKEVFGEWVTF